ncbi:MAG TPA: hypothetical protein VFK02_27185 [Kofleriaceae bacterium]|nr:hypothetical protein [Kofleriaceae bacterium]
MADKKRPKMPRPIRISRKLSLSTEKLMVLSGGETVEVGAKCTFRATGCPAHTC